MAVNFGGVSDIGANNYSAACGVLRADFLRAAAGLLGALELVLEMVLAAGRMLGRAAPFAGRALLRRRSRGAATPRSARASMSATASSSVTVSGVLSLGKVALTPP
jgi:hypothetical protein